eukprot:GFUD01080198.1.p1 GENE.GFUD01080198.1~~GFUD01080198.1.p1  ORF type:complete len:349 (-),score=71.15 GFUD01080198.1:44-1003(-)
MSTIQIRRRDVRERNPTDDIGRSSQPQQVQDVEVGPIWNQSHAAQVALKYTQNHAEYEWTGQWNTTKAGKMSTIQIRRRETGQDESLNRDLSSGIGQSACGSQGNLTRMSNSSNLHSDWEVLNLTENDLSDGTDEDTDDDRAQSSSFPSAPIYPQLANLADGNLNEITSAEPTSRMQNNTASTCSEVTELAAMFPETDEVIICDLLETNNYNVDKTTEDLLQLFPDASNKTQGDARPNVSSNSSVPTPSCPVCYEALKPPPKNIPVCQWAPHMRGVPWRTSTARMSSMQATNHGKGNSHGTVFGRSTEWGPKKMIFVVC